MMQMFQSDVDRLQTHLCFNFSVETGSVPMCTVDVDLAARADSKKLPVRTPRCRGDSAVVVNRLQGLP